jgi:hypothetical protein
LSDTPKLRSIQKPERNPPRKSNLVTGDWLENQVFAELEWTIPGIIPEGSTLLVGPPKAGKSWLVLGLALAVSSGTEALGCIPTLHPRPVLVLALEDGHRRFQSRCRVIQGSGSKIPSLLSVITDVKPTDLLDEIEDFLYHHDDEKPMIVLDTLGKVLPPSVAGESAYQRDYRIGSSIKQLTDKYPGSSFVSIHHDRKAESTDFVDAVSGTHGLAGAADTIILLERDRQSADGILHVTGRDVNEAEYSIISDGGRWELNGTSLEDASTASTIQHSKAGVGDRSQQIVDFIASKSPAAKLGDIKREFGEQAKVNLSRLEKKNRIIRVGVGEYALPNVGKNRVVG